MFPAWGPVSIVSVISKIWILAVFEARYDRIQDMVNSSKETFILFNDINLLAATTQACDCFAKVLRENLQCAIRLFTTDEDLSNYMD